MSIPGLVRVVAFCPHLGFVGVGGSLMLYFRGRTHAWWSYPIIIVVDPEL